MNQRKRNELAVNIINDFDQKCEEDQYTDTGEAWEVLNVVRGLITPRPRRTHPEPLWMALVAIVLVLAFLIWS